MIFFILFILENCTFGFANYIIPITSKLFITVFLFRAIAVSRKCLYLRVL